MYFQLLFFNHFNVSLTALHYAVQFNAVECVKVLAASGFTTHVPSADDKGVTPLILAAELGFNEVLKVTNDSIKYI